jgi:hypothetical protein
MNRLFPMALCLVAALTACSSTATTSDGIRTVVVLSADQAVRIVVPAGFGESTVAVAAAPETSDVPTTTAIVSTAEATAPETTLGAPTGDADEDAGTDEGGTDEVVTQEAPTETASTDEPPTTTSTTTTTTTTVAPVKDTIPLAEEDINPGLKLMGALDDFNACLATEGYSWIGFPNADLGANDPANQPGYLEALQLCNSRTGISSAFQDFQTSRTDLAPDVVRQENEDFIDLADCLRTKGWDIGELRPDENGLLSPGDRFSSADGDIDTGEIRDCISEIGLERAGEE